MRRIKMLIQRLNRRRDLQQWLAEQRQQRYQFPELGAWAEHDLNMQTPPGPAEPRTTQAPARRPPRATGRQASMTTGLGPIRSLAKP